MLLSLFTYTFSVSLLSLWRGPPRRRWKDHDSDENQNQTVAQRTRSHRRGERDWTSKARRTWLRGDHEFFSLPSGSGFLLLVFYKLVVREELPRWDHEVDGKARWKHDFFSPLLVWVFASLFFFFFFFLVAGRMAVVFSSNSTPERLSSSWQY